MTLQVREIGTVVDLRLEQATGQLTPDSGGPCLSFVPDSVCSGEFSGLRVGTRVVFSREVHHGPNPSPLQIWTMPLAEAAADRLDLASEQHETA